MKVIYLIFLVLYVVTHTATAAELVLHGVYQGKDIYVQNPYSREVKGFCTEAVFVNDEEVISNPRTTAYKIPLSHLKLRDLVVIRIKYREGCAPRVVNPEVIQRVEGFEFLTAQAGRNAVSWLTKGELPGGNFYVERKVTDQEWQVVEEFTAKGQPESNNYQIPIHHRGGENIYRIKYKSDDSIEAYSLNFSYLFEEAPITFYPKEATTKLYLSEETEYLIIDASGRKYKRGKGRIITIHNLQPGEYFLVIEERSEPFFKKDSK